MDPIGLCFRRVPSGDKTFSGFQKGCLKVVNLKLSYASQPPIKSKVKPIGPPSGSALRRVPPGDKTFSRFQKGHLKVVILKIPVQLSTPIKWKVETIGPPSGSALQIQYAFPKTKKHK